MMLLKRILILIIAVIISIITFSGVNKTNAESAGPIYLGLETFRSSGYGYRQGGKKVWKIAQYNSPSGGTGDISQMIYCIKAGPGFGSSDMSSGNNIKISTYNQKFNLKDLSSIGSPYRNVLPTGTNYNKLMWVLDHMYIIPENGDETAKNNFLRSVIPNERYSLLTNDDIDVVQQLAIWYFTNPTGEYHYENIELYINSMKNVDSDYKTFEDLLGDDGWDRQDAASALYEYYINNADGSYVSPNATTSPIELDDSRASMEVSGSNLIAGPFRIKELLDVDYTLTATYTNQNNQTISPRLGTKNTSGNVVATSKTLEDLVGQDFYLMIGTNTNTTTINITINASYSNKEITYWSVANAPATEQPVVIITEKDYNFSVNGSVSVNNGNYNLKLVKVDANNKQTTLSGARFSVRVNNGVATQYTTGSDGSITTNNIPITSTGTDTITIQEIQAPAGYNSLIGTLTVEVDKTISGGNYTVTGADFTSSTNENGSTISLSGNTITVTVPNEKITGSYDFQLIKKDDDTDANLQGAVFSVKINNGTAQQYTTNNSGIISVNDIEITQTGTDTITIEEITPPTGYNAMSGTIIIEVTKTTSGSSYVASGVDFAQNSQGNGTHVSLSGGVITLTVPNKKQEGSYNLQLIKKDKDTQANLSGAEFRIRINSQSSRNYTTDNNGTITIDDIQITQTGTDTITIEEITPPTGYSSMIETIVLEVTKTLSGGSYVASGVRFASGTNAQNCHVELNDGLITLTVPNEKISGSYNLQLIKQDRENQNTLQGAKFTVKINNGQTQEYTTNGSGIIEINNIAITETGTDTITIEETQAPTGYNKIIGTLTIKVTKTISDGEYVASNAQLTGNTAGSTINLSNGLITVTVPNEKQSGSYNLQLIKQDSENQNALQGAKFNVRINNGQTQEYTTNGSGIIEINNIAITETGTDTITIEETQAPTGYNKIIGTLTIKVTKTISDGEYVASNAQLTGNTAGSTINLSNGLITVTVPNEKITGSYDLQIVKVDKENNEKLTGAKFTVKINNGQAVEYTTNGSGIIEINDIAITQTGTDTITIEEIQAPTGYNKIIDTITINVTKTVSDGKYIASNIEFGEGTEPNGTEGKLENGLITVTVPNEKQSGSYNLQLIKQDRQNQNALQGAKFNVRINNGQTQEYTTNEKGIISISGISITETGTDTITIEETKAPTGYNKIIDTLTINVQKTEQSGQYIASSASFAGETNANGSTVTLSGNTVIVTVPNEKITGSYKLQLIKKDSKDDTRLANATFNVKVNNNTLGNYTTGEDGTIQTDTINIEQTGTDAITIEETQAPEGYNKIIDILNINVQKTEQGGQYIASSASFAGGTNANGSTVELQGDTIIVTVPNEKITGSYNLQLVKVDGLNQATLEGAKFTVKINDGEAVEYTTDQEGKITINSIDITQIGTDTITINETQAPTGYNKVIGELQVNVTKTISDGKYVASRAEFTTNTQPQGSTINLQGGLITVTVPNEKQTGGYGIQLIKQDGENQNPLQGAKFNVKINDEGAVEYTTDVNGTIRIDNIAITEPGTDTIIITETEAPIGYNKLIDTLTIEVNKEEQNGEYVATNATFTEQTNANGSTIRLQDGLITITVPNERQEGSYNLQLIKVDSKDASKTLQGAKFNVTLNNGQATEYETDENGKITINNIEITETGTDVITIEETQAPAGYNKIIGTLKVNIEKIVQNGAYVASNAVFTQDTTPNGSTVNLSNNLITVTVPNSYFDLSLRKFITGVNDEQITNRVPQVDVTPLIDGSNTTAIYNHTKQPVPVALGDIIIYTIRVYNEGQMDGYASEITDHLPAQLEFLPDHEINTQYRWVQDGENPRIVRTDYLSQANEQNAGDNKLDAFNGTTLDYRDVQIACRVVQTDPMPNKITNIADITDFTDENGNTVTDRDSQEDNVDVPSDEDLPNYKDDEIDQDYVPGQQDDDDFEKLILKELDLSLRKFITGVNDEQITNRVPQVDVTNLANGSSTTSIYNHTKEPVKVTLGSVVEYTIRVYNEGEVDGYVEEIKDHIPDQLEFLPDNATNQEYRWKMLDANGNVTENVEKAVAIRTDYLSKANEQTAGENELEAFNGSTLDYRDVKVAFRVIETDPMPEKITNIADISDFTDDDGNKVPDRDSEEDNVDVPSDEDLPNYKDNESDQDYVPGQQDDDDFEKVEIAEFDLSLRKFIIAVNNSEITNRIPQVDVTPLIDGSGTTAIYNHPKDPVLVSNGNIVTYTIRVYNEGEVAGYASRIKDDIPEGLEFLPDNETNQEYRWVMLNEEGNVTENIEEAVALETDYLSKEQEQEEGANLIEPFDGENLDYRDVKIAFRVIEPNTSDRILINKAQISEDTDEDGNDVKDRDSTPDEWNEGEDDQDIEKVKVQYFDLSLRKWVTQAIVNKNGEETIIDTGHKAEDDPEDIVAVDLKDSEIATTTVKFRYSIRVTNEGNIAGYAKEVKDYIPEGLIFVAEDNPLWTQVDDRTIVTTQTENTLLEPGESTEVEVILTWDKEAQNFGVMDNWAEISKDDNDFDSPDIDSTPDNNVHGEDDIDDAPVMVTVKTGEAQVYIITTLSVLGILGTGLTLIRKFVL